MFAQATLLGILVIDTDVRTGALRAEIKGHSHDILLVRAMLRSIGEEGTVIGYITVALHLLHIKEAGAVVKSDVQPRHMAFSAPDNPKEVGPANRRVIFKFPAALRGQSNKYSALIVIVVCDRDVPRPLDVRVRIVSSLRSPSRGREAECMNCL